MTGTTAYKAKRNLAPIKKMTFITQSDRISADVLERRQRQSIDTIGMGRRSRSVDWILKAPKISRQIQNNPISALRNEFSGINVKGNCATNARSSTMTSMGNLKNKLTRTAKMQPLIVLLNNCGSEIRRVEARPCFQYKNM